MKNYEDSKCVYGYMTVCTKCEKSVPSHVDLTKEVKGFPVIQCELCKRRAK